MKNLMTVRMNFDYRGEAFVFESVEELPLHLGGLLEFAESIPRRIARANEVDTYSYMFEAMECTPIKVIKAEGYISRFMHGDGVPLAEFMNQCNAVTVDMLLLDILEQHLPEYTTGDAVHEKTFAALQSAYAIGYSAGSSH